MNRKPTYTAVSRHTQCMMHFALCIMLLLATACAHDDILPDGPAKEDSETYVELLIAVPAANSLTRGNPLGGEEGNGREQGVLNEDKIHDINIFFYHEETDATVTDAEGKPKGLGMNSSDNTEIKCHFFCDFNINNNTVDSHSKLLNNTELVEGGSDENNTNSYYGTQYVTLKFRCSKDLAEKAEGINFLAVANMGEIQFTEGMKTLGKLTKLELKYYNNSWTNSYDAGSMNAEKMDFFLMSTAYDKEYFYGGKSTGTNKIDKIEPSKTEAKQYIGTTTMQRLYARLDLWYNTDNIIEGTFNNKKKVKELKYQIKDKDGSGLSSYVYITNVLPVNVMQKPSFLFKKVTDVEEADFSRKGLSDALNADNFLWGGKETPDGKGSPNASSSDCPTNYVIEPHTTDKKKDDGSEKFDDELINKLESVDWYGNTALSKVKEEVKKDATNKLTSGEYSIMNTEVGKLSYYYDMVRDGNNDPEDSYYDDYGCNHISIISYANENTHPTDCFHPNYLTGMAFRGVYVPDKIYSEYGEYEDADGTIKTGLIEMSSGIEPEKIYRYSPTAGKGETQLEQKSKYFSNENAAKTYAKAHPGDMGIITAYNAIEHDIKDDNGNNVTKLGFVCYYNLWLRHYNDENDKNPADPHPHLPMEYATVRNNIYRVAVTFSGPGDPTPTMREPDAMKARIFVRKWNFREEDEIIF